jgi:hypothetical protein
VAYCQSSGGNRDGKSLSVTVEIGDGAFVRYRDGKPIGGLAPAYFEAVSVGTWRTLSTTIETKASNADVKDAIIASVQSDDFRLQVGPGANTMQKLKRRVEIIKNALAGLPL